MKKIKVPKAVVYFSTECRGHIIDQSKEVFKDIRTWEALVPRLLNVVTELAKDTVSDFMCLDMLGNTTRVKATNVDKVKSVIQNTLGTPFTLVGSSEKSNCLVRMTVLFK